MRGFCLHMLQNSQHLLSGSKPLMKFYHPVVCNYKGKTDKNQKHPIGCFLLRDASNKRIKYISFFTKTSKPQRCPIILEIRGPPRLKIWIETQTKQVDNRTIFLPWSPHWCRGGGYWRSRGRQLLSPLQRGEVVTKLSSVSSFSGVIWCHILRIYARISNIFKFEAEYSRERCQLLMQNYVGLSFMWLT